jgi:transmembrane sensor
MSGPGHRTLQVRAEAAAWLARLRSKRYTVEDEGAFQDWLTSDPTHATAFETLNAVWEAAGPVRRDLRGKSPSVGRVVSRRAVFGGVAAAAGLGGVLLLAESAQANVYRTEIGEQRHVVLSDGSELFLDTNTKVSITLDKKRREAALEYGCANFRVASDASVSFAVNLADYLVLSNHSTFDVRRDGEDSSILMLQGRAAIESSQPAAASSRVLNRGERLTTFKKSVKLDKPDLLPLLAWQTGQAVFQNETLIQAAQEMNRYSTVHLVIADPRIQDLKISGVYRVGDNMIFAVALASLLPVLIRPFDDRIEIIGDDKKLDKV